MYYKIVHYLNQHHCNFYLFMKPIIVLVANISSFEHFLYMSIILSTLWKHNIHQNNIVKRNNLKRTTIAHNWRGYLSIINENLLKCASLRN